MSLRARLLLSLGAVALTALAVADIAIYSALKASLFNKVDQSLVEQSAFYSARPPDRTQAFRCPGQFGFPFRGGTANNAGPGGALNGRAPVPIISSNFVALVKVGGQPSSNDCPAYLGGHAYTPRLPSTFSGFSRSSDGTEVTYLAVPSTQKGGPDFQVRVADLPGQRELILAASITDTESTLHHLLWIELSVSAGAVIAALLAGWWLVRLGLRPLTAVEMTAENIAAGDLQHRVPNENPRTEVGRLARTLNVMLERIETAFSARLASEERLKASEGRLRQFVGDASHELRTPLAAIGAYAELFERGAGDNAEDLTRVMAGIRTETARMNRLVADLLTLTRLDEGQPFEHVAVELVTLCAEAVQTAQTVAPQWPITLVATQPVEVEGDPHQLRQVVDNLLANIRSHTPSGTEGKVSVAAQGNEAVVVVTDRGPGVPEEHADRVFERFFRADPSRSRTRGGAGLGLSIVKAIVATHGGSVAATSPPGEGMTIMIRLPLLEDPDLESDDGPALLENHELPSPVIRATT